MLSVEKCRFPFNYFLQLKKIFFDATEDIQGGSSFFVSCHYYDFDYNERCNSVAARYLLY